MQVGLVNRKLSLLKAPCLGRGAPGIFLSTSIQSFLIAWTGHDCRRDSSILLVKAFPTVPFRRGHLSAGLILDASPLASNQDDSTIHDSNRPDTTKTKLTIVDGVMRML